MNTKLARYINKELRVVIKTAKMNAKENERIRKFLINSSSIFSFEIKTINKPTNKLYLAISLGKVSFNVKNRAIKAIQVITQPIFLTVLNSWNILSLSTLFLLLSYDDSCIIILYLIDNTLSIIESLIYIMTNTLYIYLYSKIDR